MALWAVAIWRSPSAVRAVKQRPVWIAFTSIAAATTLGHSAVEGLLNGATGINNLATLGKNLLGILGCSAILQFVISMARPQAICTSRRALTACGLTSAFALAFLFALTPRPHNVDNFFEASTGQPLGTAYCCVFLVYLGVSMVIATWLFMSYSRHAGAAWLRVGLSFLGIGTATGALYTAFRTAHMLTRLAHQPFLTGDNTAQAVADVIEYTAIAFIIIGNSVPACGVLWGSLSDWRTLRRLRPLWNSLTGAVPDIVLEAPIHRGPRIRLHRQIIEIRDATLILASYAPPHLREEADHRAAQATPDGERRTTLAEAFWLRTACEAKRAGARPVTDCAEEPTAPSEHLDFDFDFDTEVARIRQLCEAYHSPAAEAFALENRLEQA
ncbi:MAB_1171c family putative transporter [Streptomyces rimosus]|uniref:MAB_1171c family putative transporter n=1 Tax=Streptomyces rimosus TaxID=1927 RepID=UPI001F2D58A3|nr:MAB_1171c family putative transporter [Streptomyces rimosus]